MNKENNNENEIAGGIFFWGEIGEGYGILQDGFPLCVDEIDRYIDWNHPAVRKALKHVETIFTVKERGWSLELTRRIVFGVIYLLPGFDDETLIERAKEAETGVRMYRLVEASLQSNGNLVGKTNPHHRFRWIRIAKHVKMWLKKAEIEWKPCRASAETRIVERSTFARQQKRLGPTPEFPLLQQEAQTVVAALPSPDAPCNPPKGIAPWLKRFNDAWSKGETTSGEKIIDVE